MTKEELLQKLADIEWDDFECKASQNKLSEDVWSTVSAFSNTSGGWVVFGIKQEGKKFEIQGVNNGEKTESDFLNTLRGEKFNMRLSAKGMKYNFDGKLVLAFFVPSSMIKPIYYNNPINTFIRTGSGDRRATELIARIHYEGMQRVEQLEIPETALRELVYNAIVHRDYLGADTQMKVYNDHIWLWNEGELPAGFSAEKAAKEHMSKPRNRLIANVFYKAGFIESWGRGVGMVCKAFRDSKLSSPTFENLMGGSLVVIPRGHQTELLNGNESKTQLNENQQKVYDYICVMAQSDEPLNEPLNTTRIAKELGMAYSTVKRVMKSLEENNLIRRVGSKKTGYWEIVANAIDSQSDSQRRETTKL